MKKVMFSFMFIALAAFLVSMTTNDALTDWPVPAKYKNMKNPYKGKKDADKIGKMLYNQHCKSCHGKEGFGDGKKASRLSKPMRDFTTSAVQKQTDGALYYKSFIGRDEMPNFTKEIPSKEDRWLIVNYIREMK